MPDDGEHERERDEDRAERRETARRLAGDREREKIREATQRAVERERVGKRLDDLGGDITEIKASVEGLVSAQTGMADQIRKIENVQRERDAVASALAAAVTKASERQVSTRTFLLGVATVVVMLVALLVSAGHHP